MQHTINTGVCDSFLMNLVSTKGEKVGEKEKTYLDEMIGMTSEEAAAVTTVPLEYYGSALGLGLGLDLGLGMSVDFDTGGWDAADVYSPAPAAAHSVSGVVF